MATPAGFIERFGHVPKSLTLSKTWGIRSLAPEHFCELPDCPSRERAVVDHCHAHGWVRAWVCASHNQRLANLDAVMQMSGIRVDLGSSPWAGHRAKCPACSGTPLIRARDRFSPAYYAPVAGPVAAENSVRAHLKAKPSVSLCGRIRGRLDPAHGLPLCGICQQVAGRRETWMRQLADLANLTVGYPLRRDLYIGGS